MTKANKNLNLPIPVKRALSSLGQDLRNARRRRRIPTALLAERASVSRTTLVKVENGDPGVSMGIYAKVLMALGLIENLIGLAAVKNDSLGLTLEEERLPVRIREKSFQKNKDK